LIKGKLELSIGSEIHTLESGDAIYFDSAVRHKYRGLGKQACSGVIVIDSLYLAARKRLSLVTNALPMNGIEGESAK
jgi:quercetin dioxygenase-like cupin family protein